ncbi:MAG: hypothetical protein R2690_04315 [Acidimicrobiales bacterium]
MHATLGELLADRQAPPGADLLSALAAAEEDGERLSRAELLSLAATLYSAGHRTTRDLTVNGMAVLLTEWQDVRPRRCPRRCRRYCGSRRRRSTSPRVTTDGPVLVLLEAANRDPAAYGGAEVFRPRRWQVRPTPPTPLSFAFGARTTASAHVLWPAWRPR